MGHSNIRRFWVLSMRYNENINLDSFDEVAQKDGCKKYISLVKRLEKWGGRPYELIDEDKEWLEMKPVGEEW